jgi:hypothetical protein
LLKFYRLTGDPRFLARVPEALDWLDAVRLPPDVLSLAGGRTHPTFVEIGTNRPLYVHRHGSNVVNGAYTVDDDPRNTVAHYNSFRQIDVAGLRGKYEAIKALSPAQATAGSPLLARSGSTPLPEYFAVTASRPPATAASQPANPVARLIGSLDEEGRWLSELGTTSHPYVGDGPKELAPGDFSQTYVGDETDTSPYPVEHLLGISTQAYIRNMSELIRYLDQTSRTRDRDRPVKKEHGGQ